MQRTGEWGEFFPSFLSPFGYNETPAPEYFPLKKAEAVALGFQWNDYEAPLPQNTDTIPDSVIKCEVSGRPFRLIKQELEFYQRFGLALPRKHPDIRHSERMALRNPRRLWERNCGKCNSKIWTSYAPDRPEIVYCEACYIKEVY